MICYNCVHIVSFFQSLFLWRKLPSALTVVIYIELYSWCLNSKRKIKQPLKQSQVKRRWQQIPVCCVLEWLHCHLEQRAGRAEVPLGCCSLSCTCATSLGTLCSVTLQISASVPGHPSGVCSVGARGWCSSSCTAEAPPDPGSSAWLSNRLYPFQAHPVMGMWFMGELNVHNRAVFPVLCLYKLFLLNLATVKKQRGLPSNLTLVLLVAGSGRSGVVGGIYIEAE